MDILIGKFGNQPFKLTEPSISREHALFHLDEATGKMTLRDNNSTNGTWIMSASGSFKRLTGEVPVSLNTLVRLGARHTFRIKELMAQQPPKTDDAVDISELRNIYETYNRNKMSLEAKTSNIMMMRMASLSLGSIFAILLTMLLPKDFAGDTTASAAIKVAGSIIAIGFSWIIVDVKNRSLIQRKDQNERFSGRNTAAPSAATTSAQSSMRTSWPRANAPTAAASASSRENNNIKKTSYYETHKHD